MKKLMFFVIVLQAIAWTPAWSGEVSLEGTVQGFTCVTTGRTCPVDKEDPVIAAERVFVVLTAGGDYYFVPNIDRAILARHLREQVRVSGTVNKKYKSIKAKTFEVMKNGNWKVTWSVEMEQEMMRRLEIGTGG